MKRSGLVLAAGLIGIAFAPLPATTARASCAAPYLETTSSVLTPGNEVSVRGAAFQDGCRDSMSCSAVPGCDDCEYDDPPPQPMQDVALRLVQGQRTWPLGVADAGAAPGDRADQVTWRVVLPRDARPGPARLVADGASTLRVRLR